MANRVEYETGYSWRRLTSKHRFAFAVFVAAAVLLIAGTVYVFLWFTGHIQSVGYVPSSLSSWSMGSVLTFTVHAIFWELVLIGIPSVIAALSAWQWWRRLPQTEKQTYHFSGKRSRSSNASGAASFLLFLAFALKTYVDGNWNAPIAGWTVDYVVGSMVTILIWIVAIFAIPAVAALAWWMHSTANKNPEPQPESTSNQTNAAKTETNSA